MPAKAARRVALFRRRTEIDRYFRLARRPQTTSPILIDKNYVPDFIRIEMKSESKDESADR
jgi:hypothetical protein